MKVLLIAAVIIECAVLIGLTILKKWTKKVFITVSTLTALCCIGVLILNIGGRGATSSIDQRAHLYMATRLLEEDYVGESLEVLSVVSDETCELYNCRSVRALSYNLNEAYRTAKEYLLSFEDGEFEEIILDASNKEKPVEDDSRRLIVTAALDSIAANESESLQWEAEMRVRYMGFHLSEEEQQNVTSLPALVKAAIMENRYEDAYDQIVNVAGNNDVKNAIIISNMYVNNYNRRIMAETDVEYAMLWNEATQLQADLNIASLSLPKEGSDEDIKSSDEYQNYQVIRAKYDLALTELDQESVKRAINYLISIESDDPQFIIGKKLQLARLYFMSNQLEEAKECILDIFTAENLDDTRWLGRDVAVFREAFISYISDSTNDEYSILFDKLMASLYQSVFDDENYNSFKEFVVSYLRDIFGGLIIRKVDTAEFPQIVTEVSVTNPEIEVSNGSLSLTDTCNSISSYSVDVIEVNDLSLSLVLDRSGSMEGSKLVDSKNAIRNCILQMDDNVRFSFVTFESSARLECALTNSKYLVMNLVDGVQTTGGTHISSGLSTAIDSLRATNGTRVIILLSDGADSDESEAMINSVLTDAVANNITVYTIGLQGCDEEYLQMIANRTGGQFIMVTNVSELDRTYQDIQNAMMNNYRITYTVNDTDESRSITINENSSYVEARRNYTTVEDNGYLNIYSGGLQEASYYKQTGGTDLGR